MARAPTPRVQLTEGITPVASPVDTFVRPREPVRDNNLEALAEGLAKLDAGLSNFMAARKQEEDKQDALRGEIAFHKNNGKGYAQAVAEGLIPAWASKSFVSAYKAAEGQLAGNALQEKWNAAYDAWRAKGDASEEEFQGFLATFMAENIQTQDPEVLAGLLPRVRSLADSSYQRYSQDRHNRYINGNLEANVALVDNDADEAAAEGLASGKGMDYQGFFARTLSKREQALSVGTPQEKLDAGIMAAIAAKAIELRDPEFLKFFDQKIPGKDYSFGDTEYGRKIKAETINTLERMGREAIARDKAEQKEADKKALDDVTRQTVEHILLNPTSPMPEELLVAGSKLDGEYRIKALRWRDTILSGRGQSDPAARLELYNRILNGEDAMGVIREGMENGIFRSPDDLRQAYDWAENVQKGGHKYGQIVGSKAAETILNTIKERTTNALDMTNFFAPEGWSDTGLAASHDFKQMLLAWHVQNPNASPIEVEKAISDIGAIILDRIGNDIEGGGGAPTYNREGIPVENPYRPNTPDGRAPTPEAPGAGQTATAPAQPTPQTAAPSTAPTQQATPEAAMAWEQGLPEAIRSQLRARAEAAGKRYEEHILEMYTLGVQSGRIEPVPQANPTQAPGRQGAIDPASGATIQPASLVQEAYDETAEVSPEALKLVEDAFKEVIRGTGRPRGNYALAVIKDDPLAARILDFVAGPESAGNYNAVFGNARSKNDLSKYTLDGILEMQRQMVSRGSPSSAVGRYQFIRKTLQGLKTELGLTGKERFTPELQDRLAIRLLQRRGYDAYKAGRLSMDAFANRLAMEWASLPNMKTGRSHYAGDGLNRSHVTPAQVREALNRDV